MTNRERFLRNAILLLLAAFPVFLVTVERPALQGSTLTESPVMGQVRARAQTYRESLMQEARIVTQLRAKCDDRHSIDPTFVCPDYHDKAAVHMFLVNETSDVVTTHAAAGTDTSLRVQDLSDYDQNLLTRYQNAGSCPMSLKNYSIAGFYDLCQSMLLKTTTREGRRGVLGKAEQRSQAIRSAVDARRAMRMRHRKAK